jgi:hypothetical protein
LIPQLVRRAERSVSLEASGPRLMINAMPAEEGTLNRFFAAGAKVLMMTSARRSEVFEAHWEWLGVERNCLSRQPEERKDHRAVAGPVSAEIALMASSKMRAKSGCFS